jgi:hypothetical protein
MSEAMSKTIDTHWFEGLLREMHQIEQSARRHPAVEAERLGDTPPGRAMAALAAHAEEMRTRLTALTEPIDPSFQHGGDAIGSLLSLLRRAVADRPISRERSYRFTLLGLAHGLDLAVLLALLAEKNGHPELAEFCHAYKETRKPLFEDARAQLAWFAAHPDEASQVVDSSAGAHLGYWLISGYERIRTLLARTRDETTT